MATFGFSVGDFIAAIALVKDLIDALQDSGGASDHFLSVIRELREVENALKGVRQLKERLGSYPQQAAIEQAAAQCRYCIDEFLKTITRFQPRLRLGGSGEMLRDGLRKIQWTLCRKKDAQAFLATLHGHRSSITVLLGLMQALKLHMRVLAMMAIVTRLTDQQPKHDLGELMLKVLQSNLQIYQMIMDIHNTLPLQIKGQQPVRFTDAFGRVMPMHLELVDSKEVFIAILEAKFQDFGLRKIENGEFTLQDVATKHEINLSRPWKRCFLPGQRVNMSMVISQVAKPRENSCPKCHAINNALQDSEVECSNCGMFYQRITEIGESTSPPVHMSHDRQDSTSRGSRRQGNRQPGASGNKQDKRNNRKKTFGPEKDKSSDSEDDPAQYARVRVVNKVRWSQVDRSPYLQISRNGLEVWYVGPTDAYPGDYRGWVARADHPLSFHWRPGAFSYFEITILSAGRSGIICLGFCSKDVTLDKLPGWEPESWGYHGDDGKVFADFIYGHVWGPTFTTGDTVGCGLTPNTKRGFFTKNGGFVGAIDLDIKEGNALPDLFPVVGMKQRGAHVRANFGWQEFDYDVRNIVRDQNNVVPVRNRMVMDAADKTDSDKESNHENQRVLYRWVPEENIGADLSLSWSGSNDVDSSLG
ncbi:MAG: hypothetical protein M1813_009114 [Trichoglossum hirsutum]|nr:MAG: hypothetical protein M1813_009114 [Trichoglossum hirsutum]